MGYSFIDIKDLVRDFKNLVLLVNQLHEIDTKLYKLRMAVE
ncbi:MAG: hypothetical protein ACJA1N_000631 [Saprospiraceae bacterium]|jgi:hypothetical protein